MTRYKVSFEVEGDGGWRPWRPDRIQLDIQPRSTEGGMLSIVIPEDATIEVIEEEPDSGFYVARGSTATYQYDDGTWWVWTGNSWSTVNNKPNGTLHKLSPK